MNARIRAMNDLNSPKFHPCETKLLLRQVASSLNFSHSFVGRSCLRFCAFLPPFLPHSFATSLSPPCFRNAELETHVPIALQPRFSRWSCVFVDGDSTFSTSTLSTGFSRLFIASRQTRISFHFSRLPRDYAIIMILLEKRLKGL